MGREGIDKKIFVPIMPIPLSEGIKGFENREFETTFSVASSARLREDCGAFSSPNKIGDSAEVGLTELRSLVNIPVCLGRV